MNLKLHIKKAAGKTNICILEGTYEECDRYSVTLGLLDGVVFLFQYFG